VHVRLARVRRLPRGQWGPVAALLAWVGVVAAAIYVGGRAGEPIPLCHFKRLTGVPCPTCGGTRAALRAGEGDLWGSFLANPLLFTLLGTLTVVLGLRFVAGRRLDLGLTARQQQAAWILLAVRLLLNWAYVIRFVG